LDTVGILAQSGDVLRRSAEVLLAGEANLGGEQPAIHLMEDAFAMVDSDVRQALEPAVERLRGLPGERVKTISLAQIFGNGSGSRWETWHDTYSVLLWAEVRSSLGAWVAATRPQLGPVTASGFKLVDDLDRSRVRSAIETREMCFRTLRETIGPRDLWCMPTVPSSAPAKASNAHVRASPYYRRTLSLTALAGVGRLPQVSIPVARTADSPVGLSLIAAHGQDLSLVAAAEEIGRALGAA
jgi:amidase